MQARAVWHEDVGDPWDVVEITIELILMGDTLHFWMYDTEDERTDAIVFSKLER